MKGRKGWTAKTGLRFGGKYSGRHLCCGDQLLIERSCRYQSGEEASCWPLCPAKRYRRCSMASGLIEARPSGARCETGRAERLNWTVAGQRELPARPLNFGAADTNLSTCATLDMSGRLLVHRPTHLCTSISVSSLACILAKCCLKLSNLGHTFSCLGQLSPKHL